MTVISVNELITTCSKIAELHGFRWGTDSDFSELICWLELNQLDGLKRLQQLLDSEQLTATPTIDYQTGSSELRLNANNHSASSFSLACMDLAIGLYYQRAEVFSHFDVNVNNASDGIFFLAALGHIKFQGSASIVATDADQLFKTTVTDNTYTTNWYGSSSDSFIKLRIGREPSLVDTDSTTPAQRGPDVETQIHVDQRANALKNGINVDSVLWNSLVSYSHRILVPATEHSRNFGTGGGNAND